MISSKVKESRSLSVLFVVRFWFTASCTCGKGSDVTDASRSTTESATLKFPKMRTTEMNPRLQNEAETGTGVALRIHSRVGREKHENARISGLCLNRMTATVAT